jgi:lipoprotein-anchoring transpeptidase ErfK/SrfK
MIAPVKDWGRTMAALVLRRTAIFVMIVMMWALLAAAVAHTQTPQSMQPQPAEQPSQVQQSQPQHSPNVDFQAALPSPAPAQPQEPASPPQSPSIVPLAGYRAGTIVVKTSDRRLYYVLKGDKAWEFPVGVGKQGWAWFGRAAVEAKYIKPAWQAPPELHRGSYGPVIEGGSPRNPMGVAALTMRKGEYAIHGTNHPKSIGGFVSHGCIRMYNKDITKLYAMVSVGTPVIVEK